MVTYVKFRSRRLGRHVHVTVFTGEAATKDSLTYANAGKLILSASDYFAIEDALRRGRGGRTWFDVEWVDS